MSFAADMTRFCKKTAPEYLREVTHKVVIELGTRAVFMSPVGDATYWQSSPPPGYTGGRFRGNWQYGFNSVPSNDLNTIDKNGASTINAIISSSSGEIGVHYIVNNTPYAERIENGWSYRQAPQGILKLLRLEFDDIVRVAKSS